MQPHINAACVQFDVIYIELLTLGIASKLLYRNIKMTKFKMKFIFMPNEHAKANGGKKKHPRPYEEIT